MHPLIAAFIFALSSGALAETFSGVVAGITDGDTITVVSGQRQVKVRLVGIDAPEMKQPFGTRSKQSLSGLCFRRTAIIESLGRDQYGRVLGRVNCAGRDANAEQVRTGMAWVTNLYLRKADRGLRHLQETARDGRRGLWADRNPVPPWKWRKRKS
jgi:endonuclease YncB( thermonuclease family)